MRSISQEDIRRRVARDNPWWENGAAAIPEAASARRVYFAPFKALALDFGVRRATVMLGPRRVGKTFLIKQMIAEAIAAGHDPRGILYVSIDTPIYSGMALQDFLHLMPPASGSPQIAIFDEIQYLRNWEVHLKDLVDHYPEVKFIATGSAAAALRLKSQESGAGRFSDFMLPPLTFFEFLNFLGEDEELIETTAIDDGGRHIYQVKKLEALNSRFIDYLNFGGYPEAVLNRSIRENPEQFIRNDIIDKVLLKDLPSLYGIQEIQELNKLFSFLAYNAGNEASLENISQESGISKPTIKRYIEYLESAFLIIKLSNIDESAAAMKRERNFKIYLNNPSMRAALFAPVEAGDTERIGHLTECAIFSQWQHSPYFNRLRYARWRNEGEVDIVHLDGPKLLPVWICEIKWSDRIERHQAEVTRSAAAFLRRHRSIRSALFTSRTVTGKLVIEGTACDIWPSALYCYTVGRNVTRRLLGDMAQIGGDIVRVV